MALQQFVFGFVVLIICTSKGGHAALVCGNVEGHDDSPKNWPWQASITFDGCYLCGGSLINDQWVLTSALYFYMIPDTVLSSAVVHLGSTVSSSFSDSSVTREVVAKTCYHSDDDYNYFDICLLKLSAPVSFSPNIQPVCLAAQGSTFHSGDSGLVAGWSTEHYGYLKPRTYNEASVSVVGPKECQCRTQMMFNNTLCIEFTNYTRKESSAFPVMVKQDSVWVQVGIIFDFWGNSDPCLSPKLSEYQDWITEVTGGNNQSFVSLTSPGEDSDMDFNCSYSIDPNTYPIDPNAYPIDPSAYPTDPNTYPTDPSTYPTDPNTNPTDPNTNPTDPNTNPTDPSTYPYTTFNSGDKIIPHFGQLLSLCGLTLLLFVMG